MPFKSAFRSLLQTQVFEAAGLDPDERRVSVESCGGVAGMSTRRRLYGMASTPA